MLSGAKHLYPAREVLSGAKHDTSLPILIGDIHNRAPATW